MLFAMKTVDGNGEAAKQIKTDLDSQQKKVLDHFATKNPMPLF